MESTDTRVDGGPLCAVCCVLCVLALNKIKTLDNGRLPVNKEAWFLVAGPLSGKSWPGQLSQPRGNLELVSPRSRTSSSLFSALLLKALPHITIPPFSLPLSRAFCFLVLLPSPSLQTLTCCFDARFDKMAEFVRSQIFGTTFEITSRFASPAR